MPSSGMLRRVVLTRATGCNIAEDGILHVSIMFLKVFHDHPIRNTNCTSQEHYYILLHYILTWTANTEPGQER
jgi:hypothetical protein